MERGIAAALTLAAVLSGWAYAATLGARVDNVAEVSYTLNSTSAQVTTPAASFIIEAVRTPSTIEFLRYAPYAPDATAARLVGSDFLPAGGGTFQPVGPMTSAGGTPIDLSGPVGLTPAPAYHPGEPVIIRVIDPGQNGDSGVIETVVATIQTANGDFITLRLYESGADTGEFYAWTPSASGAVIRDDAILTIEHGASLLARYQDPFDPSEVSTDSAGADPFGRVFDSLTGALIDGAGVSIIDNATGQPAQVFGIDGVASFPATITTGQTVYDSGGTAYPLGPGEFRFPIMPPGNYRIIVSPPAGYAAPSTVAASSFTGLPNSPFTIVAGSYGVNFTLDGTGDIELDIPVDPLTDIVVRKKADVDSAAIGDFVRFEISVENRASLAAAIRIEDRPPSGFRYQGGSARIDGAPAADPVISASGATVSFDLGIIQPGAVMTLAYVVEIAAGAKRGTAVNRAQAMSANGIPISNLAEAAVEIDDDFLTSSMTIVGRIIEDGCKPEESNARRRGRGQGLPGVRLYMENGATVVSDEDGLYHFENVSPRAHVVQVDEESLPDGYELIRCERNTRFAGSARSQFVDASGGKIWRVNFHVRRGRASAAAPAKAAPKAFNAETEYLSFDKPWLNQQTEEVAWAYPAPGVTPSSPSVNVGLKHPAALRPTLFLNGVEVPAENFAGREVSILRTVALTRWKGVDLLEGENRLEAVLKDAKGAEVVRLTRSVDFVTRVARATLLPERTQAVADGRSRPVIAVKVTDGAGRPVHAGRLIEVEVASPFRAAQRRSIEERSPLDAPLSAKAGVAVGQNGVALIELEPTAETGLARIKIPLDGGGSSTLSAYVKPALRDWIVVGLADAEAIREKGGGALRSPGQFALDGDGRIAGFAKGAVKGGWLVTIAGDSKNERGESDDDLFDVIDPDDRYPLYGDRSDQRFEAQSRYPIFVKAEKDQFKAQFGDYEAGLTQSSLSRYDRRLSGLHTVYESERFSFTGFAAETNQAFVKDEIAADGTSGPFRLTTAPLVRNSEAIVIETRDRFRPDQVLASTALARYADYDIDFETGEIILRLPVPAADSAFNPNVLVVNYETAAPVDRNLTAGGRGAVRFLSERAEAGVSYIHEEAPGVSGDRTDLVGTDLRLDLTEKDVIRLEYATTLRDGPSFNGRADAILAEVSHTGDRLTAKAWFSDVEPEFGLAQQSTAVAGVRRFGAEASLRIDEFENQAGSKRGARFIDVKAYREESLQSGASRDLAEAAIRQEATSTSGSVGLRAVREQPAGGAEREGLYSVTSLRQRFDRLGLSLRAAHERPIAGEDASALFPTRTSLGFDQRLFEGFTLSATHEILDGDAVSQSNTTVGLTAEPWTGGKLTVAGDRLTQDSAERIGAVFAVDQQVRLSDRWTGSLGLARREDLKERGAVDAVDDIVPDAPRSPFEEAGGAYTSLYVGAGYRGEATSGSSRFEMKKTATGQRYMVAAGAARELSEQLSFAAAGRYQADNNDLVADERRFDLRLGASWRPRDEGLIIFNRFDVKQREADQQSESWKAVHNLTVNAMATDRLQVALNHGFKYSVLTTDGATYRGVTELIGAEARYDLTDRLDFGIQGAAIYSFNARTLDYSVGPSIGYTPADNVWLSLGWNFAGFIDDDFAAADYSRAGPYVKLRIKFDQSTARGLLEAISPERVQ